MCKGVWQFKWFELLSEKNKEVLNCTPCTFNNSSLKVLGVAGHMSAHCRAAFSVPFISSVHDVKLSHWFQMLECYI